MAAIALIAHPVVVGVGRSSSPDFLFPGVSGYARLKDLNEGPETTNSLFTTYIPTGKELLDFTYSAYQQTFD